jgi:thiosulfate dehydrogenase
VRLPALALAVLAAACGGTPEDRLAADVGAELFADPRAFTDRPEENVFSCADCHATTDPAPSDRMWPGHTLAGAADRTSFWGGDLLRLEDAVDACIVYFMLGSPMDPQSDESRALYEYLVSLAPGDTPLPGLPMTVDDVINDVPRGDPARGEVVYDLACRSCHGEAHTGTGNLVQFVLPEDTEDYDLDFPTLGRAIVTIDKIRKGRFYHIGGQMPMFTTEVLSDEDLGALLAFLGIDPLAPP